MLLAKRSCQISPNIIQYMAHLYIFYPKLGRGDGYTVHDHLYCPSLLIIGKMWYKHYFSDSFTILKLYPKNVGILLRLLYDKDLIA